MPRLSRLPRPLVALPALLTALLLALAGCSDTGSPDDGSSGAGAPADGSAVAAASIRVVSADSAAQLLEEEPDRTVIDVRTPAEFAAGHLQGAVLVDYNAPDFAQRIAELDRDEPYLIYCRSGNRSAGARQVMEELGFTDVADVQGGITAWNAAGLPVVTG